MPNIYQEFQYRYFLTLWNIPSCQKKIYSLSLVEGFVNYLLVKDIRYFFLFLLFFLPGDNVLAPLLNFLSSSVINVIQSKTNYKLHTNTPNKNTQLRYHCIGYTCKQRVNTGIGETCIQRREWVKKLLLRPSLPIALIISLVGWQYTTLAYTLSPSHYYFVNMYKQQGRHCFYNPCLLAQCHFHSIRL